MSEDKIRKTPEAFQSSGGEVSEAEIDKNLMDSFSASDRRRACPITLCNHHFVWIVYEMLVGKRFEKGKRLLLMSFYSMRRRLVGPSHHAVRGVAFVERCKLLRVPGIVQRLHVRAPDTIFSFDWPKTSTGHKLRLGNGRFRFHED